MPTRIGFPWDDTSTYIGPTEQRFRMGKTEPAGSVGRRAASRGKPGTYVALLFCKKMERTRKVRSY